jgi:LemA protein
MKKSWIIIIVVVLIALLIFTSFKRNYNRMIQLNENVTRQWANVENVYQRRLDLIPNLVSTVKGYADFEKETLTEVIEARSRATSVTVDPNNINAESLQNFQQMQGALSSALSRLLVVVERYPDLKANQNFLDLQAQLEGTENRISVERRKFNETAQLYNTYIKRFPQNIYANIFNFEERAYFTADKEAAEAPKVEF